MFEKEAEEYRESITQRLFNEDDVESAWQKGAEFGYNKANEWHYPSKGELPRQDGHTCFSVHVLAANNKKWVYFEFDSGKWFCGNKEVKVTAWKEIVLPELPKESE